MSSQKNELNGIDRLTRRQLLGAIAMAVTASRVGGLPLAWGQHVHKVAKKKKQKKGYYKPQFFKRHEYQTVQQLVKLIIPADEYSGSAVDAGAPEFIDLLCGHNQDLANIYIGGLLWIDSQMSNLHGTSFIDATDNEQTALLEQMVQAADPTKVKAARITRYGASDEYQGFSSYRIRPSPDIEPGTYFFHWLRKMTVDAFYTSPIGIKDIGYQGNKAVSDYKVPASIIEEALKKGPIGTV